MKAFQSLPCAILLVLSLCLAACSSGSQTDVSSTDTTQEESDEYETLVWPSEGIATYIPKPVLEQSPLKGAIYLLNNQKLTICVADFSEEDFQNYIADCQAYGFDEHMVEDESRYVAYNADGDKVTLNWDEKHSVIRIDLEVAQAQESDEDSETNPSEQIQVDFDNFQDAMDEYENFFIEYCNFMRAYRADDSQTDKEEYEQYYTSGQEKLKELEQIGAQSLSEENQEIYDTTMSHIDRLLELSKK